MITIEQLKETKDRTEQLNRYLNIDAKKIQLEEEQLRTQAPGFWDDQKRAEAQMKLVKGIERWIKDYKTNNIENLRHKTEITKDDVKALKENTEKVLKDLENKMFDHDINAYEKEKLFEECKKQNANTYFVSSADEVDEKVLADKPKLIGICGATSTPKWQMQEVKDKLKNIINYV